MLKKIFWSTISNKEKVEKYQKIIREKEWYDISKHILEKSNFLDVGCGAGYAMMKAKEDHNCTIFGVDPEPGAHGVGRYIKDLVNKVEIKKGVAESIPFESNSIETVYCSHVLEHVNDENKSLKEIKRVLKEDGVLIIGMPTSSMAFINLISQLLFTTHIKIFNFLINLFSKKCFNKFTAIFRISSHSYPRANSIWYDIKNYKISRWKKLIEEEFEILEVKKPFLYPYPDFPQFFKIHKNRFFSSSVFFICSKK